jgi:hypothetical protein
MRKALLFLFVAGFFITCKKDKSPSSPKETVLSKIILNNIIVYEFLYSPQKHLERINSYDEKTGKFEYAAAFEYDADGNMFRENQYSSTNKLVAQVNYALVPGGKIRQHEYKSLSGADSGQITNRVKYTYDGAGRISQRAWVDLVTDAVETTTDFTWYNNNNIKSSSAFYYYNGKELQWKTEYTDGNALPTSLVTRKGYPVNFLLFELVTTEKHSTSYNNGSVNLEIKETFSDRKYDNNGFLLRQTISRKSLKPVLPVEVIEAQYEYIQL